MSTYQPFIDAAIREAREHAVAPSAFMCDIFHALMESERQMFLRDPQVGEGNKANGYYPRTLSSFFGKLNIHVPRDRMGSFRPMLLEIADQQSSKINELALELYSSGLSTHKVHQILQTMFGERMSAAKVSELAQGIQPVREAWQNRPISDIYVAIIIDALRMHVRRDSCYHEACFTAIGVLPDGRRDVLGNYFFPEEGANAWREVFATLTSRGLHSISLVISDELSGIREAVRDAFPEARHQLCLVHRKRNLLPHIRSDQKADFNRDFDNVFRVATEGNSAQAITERLAEFVEKWKSSIRTIGEKLSPEKVRYYAAFLEYPITVQRMLYTTNWIERLNRQVRKVTKRVHVFPTVDSALNLVFMAQQEFVNGCYRRHIPAFYNDIRPLYQNSSNPFSDTIT